MKDSDAWVIEWWGPKAPPLKTQKPRRQVLGVDSETLWAQNAEFVWRIMEFFTTANGVRVDGCFTLDEAMRRTRLLRGRSDVECSPYRLRNKTTGQIIVV